MQHNCNLQVAAAASVEAQPVGFSQGSTSPGDLDLDG